MSGWEQRNADFCNAQTNAQMAYIEAEREVDRLQAENAKLREELDQWHSLTAGIELPEYPITEFQPKDLERENAKLRELVRDMWEFECGPNSGANSAAEWAEIADALHDRMRELGVDDG